MHHVFTVAINIDLENLNVYKFKLGNMPKQNDLMTDFVFDDLKFLENNMSNEFLTKTFLKYLNN